MQPVLLQKDINHYKQQPFGARTSLEPSDCMAGGLGSKTIPELNGSWPMCVCVTESEEGKRLHSSCTQLKYLN